jgi:predicted nucleotidyltransferase
MDTRGATALVDDPRGSLARLEKVAETSFGHLAEARRHTEQQVREKVAALAERDLAGDLAIVVFGSWARGELTEGSDDDWAVIVARAVEADDAEVARALALARERLGGDERQPGAQAVFGVAFDVDGLVYNIGLDADTNRNLTRRMLLLLESRELAGSIHAASWSIVLDRYLNFGIKNNRPPRFLLNDLVRYWRTICVDFEGKHRDTGGQDPKWVTRNAKLRTSRKLLFAGGLLPILLCHLRSAENIREFLTRWLTATPSDRLAAAFLHYDAVDEGVRTFAAYDRWIALMQDRAARQELKTLRAATRDDSELWQEIRTLGEELQRGLNALLFDTPLRGLAPQYAIF